MLGMDLLKLYHCGAAFQLLRVWLNFIFLPVLCNPVPWAHIMGRNRMSREPFRPVRDETVHIVVFSTRINP